MFYFCKFWRFRLAKVIRKKYNIRSYMFYYLGRAIQTVGFFGLGRSNLGVLNYLSEKYPRLEFILRASENVKCDGIF